MKNRFITAVVRMAATADEIKVNLYAFDANSIADPNNYNGTATTIVSTDRKLECSV